MAENEMNKSVEDISQAVDNIGGLVTSIVNACEGAMTVVSTVADGIEKTVGVVEKLGKGMAKVPDIFSNAGKKAGELKNSLSNLGSALILPVEDMFANLGEVPIKLGGITSYLGTWGSMVGEAFGDILGKAAVFGTGFVNLIGIGAGIGIVVAGLGLLHQAYGDEIDGLIEMMMTRGPEIIMNLCNGIIAALPALMEQGALLLNSLMEAITVNLPVLLAGGFGIISGLITGIAEQLPMLVPTAVQLILTLVQGLIENIPQLVSSGLTLVTGLAQGLMNALPFLIQAVPSLIGSLVSGIVAMLPQIILTGVQLIGQLVVGLIQAIPDIAASIPQIIEAIKTAFTSVDWGKVGSDIIKGIKNGLSNAARTLAEAAANAAKDALNWVKEKLGIHSPSRVFRDEVGRMMALGMGIGFETNVPVKQMRKGLGQALETLRGQADIAMTSVGNSMVYANAVLPGSTQTLGFDFDEFERRQRRVNAERADRPVFLNGRQVNRALKKGVPVTV